MHNSKPIAKKIVALHGALNIDNFGDVLLGRIFADWLRNCGLRVIAPSAAPNIAEQIGADCTLSYGAADALLYIGGGYFGEPSGSRSMRWRWGRKMARVHLMPGYKMWLRRRPVGIVGVEFGPISNRLARYFGLPIWKFAKVLCVRNHESRDYLQAWGVARPVDVATDAALSLYDQPLSNAMQAAKERTRALSRKPIVGLHLTDKIMASEGGDLIWNALKSWRRSRDVHLLFIADQRNTPAAEETIRRYRQMQGEVPDCSVQPYEGIDDLVGVLAASDLIITSKLHVGIVGVALKRAVLSFPSHPKTERFYRHIGRSEWCLPPTEWKEKSLQAQLERSGQFLGLEIDLPHRVVERAKLNRLNTEAFVRTALK